MSATNSQATDDQELDYKSQYKNKLSSLDSYKSEAEAQLAQQQAASRQAAQLSYQKLLKYLPQQTAGYSVGMTETAKIAANNSLQRQLADADAQHQSSLAELNRYVAEQENAAFDQYYQRGQEEKQWDFQQEQWQYQKDQDAAAKTAAEQEFAFNAAVSAIEGQEFDTVAGLENYVRGLQGEVSDEQFKILQNKMEYYKEGVAEVEADAKQAEADKDLLFVSTKKVYLDDADGIGEIDDGIAIKTEKSDIDVKTDGKADDKMKTRLLNAAKAQGRTIENREVLAFDKKFYVYVNGEFYKITDEDDLSQIIHNEKKGLDIYYGVD